MNNSTYKLRHNLFGLDKGTLIDFGYDDEAQIESVDSSGSPVTLVFDREAVENSKELFAPEVGKSPLKTEMTNYDMTKPKPQQSVIMNLQEKLNAKLNEAEKLLDELRELTDTLRIFLD